MAIWQFSLTVIPRNGLIEKYGYLPDKLFIDSEKRQHFFDFKDSDIDSDDEIEYNDALSENWWHLTDILPIEIIHQMDKIVKRADYGDDFWINWKTYTFGDKLEIDNDAGLLINENTGKIEELSFRADLREPELLFLSKMLTLGQLYNWVFMDKKGFIANPNHEEVGKLIENSNALRFLKNPRQFLEGLSAGEIKIE
jgi:hypothetical protein